MKLLVNNNYGKLDEKTYVNTNEPLQVLVVHSFSDFINLFAVVNDKKMRVVNNKFTINDFTKEEISIKLELVLNGKILKEVPCESLKVVNLNGEKQPIPEIETLKAEILAQNEKIKELTELVNTLKADNETTRALVLELNELDKGE